MSEAVSWEVVKRLCSLSAETEWLEFKRNNDRAEEIGEYISALANSAALHDRQCGYLVWGVDDSTHEVVGTTFSPTDAKKGNEELENWLLRLLSPQPSFEFHELAEDGKKVVVLVIESAMARPVQFQGQEYVRVGSYKKKLRDHPEKARALWLTFDKTPFESRVAVSGLTEQEVTSLLDYPAYFDLLDLPLPETRRAIIEALRADAMIRREDSGRWSVLNLGAILFAKQIGAFPRLARKAARVVVYDGKNRMNPVREQEGGKGYASGFQGLIGFINDLLPANEVVEKALRRNVRMYPERAIRELVANALIHQDFTIRGAGPMVEIFDDRMEILNPGVPLIDTDRFIDNPPRSRNEALAGFMRRIGVCEERGSGIDRVVIEAELHQLPAPLFEAAQESTRAVLFSPRALEKMDQRDRVRACYFHACLRWVTHEFLTNASVRERFGIEQKNAAKASRLIREAVDSGKIVPYDPDASKKTMKYVPWWAGPDR